MEDWTTPSSALGIYTLWYNTVAIGVVLQSYMYVYTCTCSYIHQVLL